MSAAADTLHPHLYIRLFMWLILLKTFSSLLFISAPLVLASSAVFHLSADKTSLHQFPANVALRRWHCVNAAALYISIKNSRCCCVETSYCEKKKNLLKCRAQRMADTVAMVWHKERIWTNNQLWWVSSNRKKKLTCLSDTDPQKSAGIIDKAVSVLALQKMVTGSIPDAEPF